MIAAAYWAGYLAAHPAWPLIFAACCAAAAAFVALMRAEDRRDDRAAGLPQAPRRGTRFRAGGLTALARGTSWGRRAIALRIHGITIDVTGDVPQRADLGPGHPWYRVVENYREALGLPGRPETPADTSERPRTPPAEPSRLATGAERDSAAPWYAPELAPPAELSPWEHKTQWFSLDAIDADIQARAAAGGDA